MAGPSGLDRLINLSDAVVAIAITLLVLPLVDIAATDDTSHMSEVLSNNEGRIFAFALSFVVISRFWLIHHSIYLRVVGYTPWLIWVNFLWLLSIVFLPFPTELIASGGVSDATSSGVYIGTLLATTVSNELAQWIIIRSPELQAEEARGSMSLVPVTLATISMLLALVISVSVPSVGLWSLLLLVPLDLEQRVIVSRRRRARDGSRPKVSE